MRHGDLDNTPVPRIVVVWENALGYLPEDRRDQWRELSRAGDWDAVARLFVLDQLMLRKITDLTYRFSVSIDIVTYCGPEAFAEALARLLDRENVPVRIVFASQPERMARATSFEPDIMAVYDANPEHALVYGRKGVHLTSFRQLGG
jgi:hypothetical protein